MTDHLTEEDMMVAIPGLTRTRLIAFIETEMVIPLRRESHGVSTLVFRQIDFARVQLLCDLTDDLDLDNDTLGVVISLIDQLHAKQQDLLAIARAIVAEPPDVRARIGAAILTSNKL